jgi:hypothetical protein
MISFGFSGFRLSDIHVVQPVINIVMLSAAIGEKFFIVFLVLYLPLFSMCLWCFLPVSVILVIYVPVSLLILYCTSQMSERQIYRKSILIFCKILISNMNIAITFNNSGMTYYSLLINHKTYYCVYYIICYLLLIYELIVLNFHVLLTYFFKHIYKLNSIFTSLYTIYIHFKYLEHYYYQRHYRNIWLESSSLHMKNGRI